MADTTGEGSGPKGNKRPRRGDSNLSWEAFKLEYADIFSGRDILDTLPDAPLLPESTVAELLHLSQLPVHLTFVNVSNEVGHCLLAYSLLSIFARLDKNRSLVVQPDVQPAEEDVEDEEDAPADEDAPVCTGEACPYRSKAAIAASICKCIPHYAAARDTLFTLYATGFVSFSHIQAVRR